MSLGKAWRAAMLHPQVHTPPRFLPSYLFVPKLSFGPDRPRLQEAILAECTTLDVTSDMR